MFELFLLLSLIGTGLYFNKDDVHKLQSMDKENIQKMQHNNIYQSNILRNSKMAHQGKVRACALASKNVNSNVFQKNYKKVERNTEMGKSNVEHFTNGFSKNI